MIKNSINVTKTYLPPKKEFLAYIDDIWASNQLTNDGRLVKTLEEKLKDFLNVEHLYFVSNGTVALQIALKALDLHGEIITTPFSYVATTSSIVWEHCKPVFVDIDPSTLTIDPALIERAITPQTKAILPTHVYGIPCDVEKIRAIAEKYKIKLIYDAAHTFGVKYKDNSLASYGDISILSFHATKIFHTAEGGALVTKNDTLSHRIKYMRNFGHKGLEDFWGLGINGKNSELHAAMGLSILPHIKEIIQARKQISGLYDQYLQGYPLTRPSLPEETDYNYSYYPILFQNEESLVAVKAALNAQSIYPRRYFFPSLISLPYIEDPPLLKYAQLSERVLCLPLYADLSHKEVTTIIEIIKACL